MILQQLDSEKLDFLRDPSRWLSAAKAIDNFLRSKNETAVDLLFLKKVSEVLKFFITQLRIAKPASSKEFNFSCSQIDFADYILFLYTLEDWNQKYQRYLINDIEGSFTQVLGVAERLESNKPTEEDKDFCLAFSRRLQLSVGYNS